MDEAIARNMDEYK